MELAEENNICSRCQRLRLSDWVQDRLPDDNSNDSNAAASKCAYGVTIAEFNIKKLKDDCKLCQVFQEFVQRHSTTLESWSHGSGVKDVGQFRIMYYHTVKDEIHTRYFSLSVSHGKSVVLGIIFPMPFPATQTPRTAQFIEDHNPDLDSVNKWIQDCNEKHCPDPNGSPSPTHRSFRLADEDNSPQCIKLTSHGIRSGWPLRVIDCFTRRIRIAIPNEPYVCLSYVWGNSNKTQDREAGISDSPGIGSEALPEEVPKTIEDAIYVAIKLGIPQLWVDQFCIDGHDPKQKEDSIASMVVIYGNAELTIIALGEDANSGLPGISGSPRTKQKIFEIAGRMFTLVPDVVKEVRDARWNSRGWTYQEAILSRRRLVFTDSQLYFQCRTHHYLEGLSQPIKSGEDSLAAQFIVFPIDGVGRLNTNVYGRLVEYFSRDLSYNSDSLNAIEGVLRAFSYKSRPFSLAKHFYGIPIRYDLNFEESDTLTTSFWAGMTWRCEGSGQVESLDPLPEGNAEQSTARQDTKSNSPLRLELSSFPSWSWASIKATRSARPGQMHNADHRFAKYQDRPVIKVTRKGDGRSFTIAKVINTPQFETYRDFSPTIEVNTWATRSILLWTSSKEENALRILGTTEEKVYMDDESQPWTGQHVVALLIGFRCGRKLDRYYTILALLLQLTTPGTHRRVGIWHSRLKFSQTFQGPTTDISGLLDALLDSSPRTRGNTWRRETFLIA